MASKTVKIGIVVFPGSNCDYDCMWAFKQIPNCEPSYVWHKDATPGEFDVFMLPGGFSYGDYLRCGAIARFSPVMQADRRSRTVSSSKKEGEGDMFDILKENVYINVENDIVYAPIRF